MHPTLQRLKERKLVQWGLAYLAGAFVVLQVMETLEGPLGLGQGSQQLVLVVLGVGLPITVVFAWYHGEQGHQRVTGPELVIIACLLGLGALALRLATVSEATSPEAVMRTPTGQRSYQILLPDSVPLALGTAAGRTRSIVLNPGGTSLVYVALTGDGTYLYQRSLTSFGVRRLPGTGGATDPFFSPDGEWVGFFRDGDLLTIRASGEGTPNTLGTVSDPHGAAWRSDNRIFVSSEAGRRLSWIPASGGEFQDVALCPESDCRSPSLLPDGRSAVVDGPESVGVVRLDDGSRSMIQNKWIGSEARVGAGGSLLVALSGRLFVASLDLQTAQLASDLEPVLDLRTEERAAQYTVGPDGTIVYVPGAGYRQGYLVRLTRAGERTASSFPRMVVQYLQASPDGERIAASVDAGFGDWVTETVIFDLTSGRRRALDVGAVQPGQPTVGVAWSPDGSELAYGVGHISDHGSLLATNLLTQQTRTITEVGGFPTSWNADGLILYDRYTEGLDTELAHREVWSVATDGSEPRPFVGSDRWLSHGQRSADGRWISYSVAERQRVLTVEPADRSGARYEVAIGAMYSRWSGHGSRLYFMTDEGALMTADFGSGIEFGVEPEELLRGPFLNFDLLDDDGDEFIVIERADPRDSTTELRVITNWLPRRGAGN